MADEVLEFEMIGRAPHAGKDENGNPKMFYKGDRIKTTEELDTKFQNKFRRVGGKTKSPDTLDVSPEARAVVDRPNIDVLKTKRNRLMAKAQTGADKQVSQQSEKLHKKFRQEVEFDRSQGDAVPNKEVEEDEDLDLEEDESDVSAETEAEEEDQDFGDDVTDQFPKAGEKNLKVFKEGKSFTVVSDNAKVNEEDLTSKKKVNEFIDEVEFEEDEQAETEEEEQE